MGSQKRSKEKIRKENELVENQKKKTITKPNHDFEIKTLPVEEVDSSSESEYSGLDDDEESKDFDDEVGIPQINDNSPDEDSGEEEEDEDEEDEEDEDEEDEEDDEEDNEEDKEDEEGDEEDEDEDKEVEQILKQRQLFQQQNSEKTETIAVNGTTSEDTEKAEESDSDVEEETGNTVGKVPMHWYKDFPHIGYTIDGKQVLKPAVGDELDKFLDRMDNPDFGRTVRDETNMKDIVLNEEEIDIIQRIQKGTYAHKDYNEHKPFEDLYSKNVSIHPMYNRPEPKRRFIPSKHEHKRIMKIVRAIRNGWIVPNAAKVKKPRYYPLWNDDDTPAANNHMHMPAPKRKLPGHAESYNPPKEYLMTKEEIQAWEDIEPEKREQNFIPQSYSRLRYVPRYNDCIKEQFERCLDLYLCPRTRKMRIHADPESLIPKLPSPKDLQPFPTTCMLVYKGHTKPIRTVDIDPTGQFVFSGSDDHTLKVWELITGRCLKTFSFEGPVTKVSCSPSVSVSLVAVVVGQDIFMINPLVGSTDICQTTDLVFSRNENETDKESESTTKANNVSEWVKPTTAEYDLGFRLKITHPKPLMSFTWHHKGDYCAAVMNHHIPVVIHQISKRRTQSPFAKSPGPVQCVCFHPNRPYLLVATQRYVRIYNLAKQEMMKKLITNCKWVSSIDVHPGGDNVIIGSYDKRLCWFDLDLSSKPYKTLRYHKEALRSVRYHKRYPMFASASDDGMVHVFHGRVFNDLMQNPLIVPVKRLSGHERNGRLGVMDLIFHPKQPWVVSAGADNTMRLFT